VDEDRILNTIRRVNTIPLARAALCDDCNTVFVINGNCPVCDSAHFVPLARWIRPA
jgi:hypothetical protein